MFNFNGMPYKRSGRAGGESVSWIGMLVLLLVSSLILLPSCTGDDTETTVVQCTDGSTAASEDQCPEPVQPDPVVQCLNGSTAASLDMCEDPETVYDEVVAGTCEEDNERHGGSDSSDPIEGTDGKDCIDGKRGDDMIKGLGGDDDITGGGGDDTLYGGDGNDMLDGGDGDDTLMGEGGDDELTGGKGDNTLDGGDGTDIAIFMGAMRVDVDLVEGDAIVQHSSPTGGGSLRDSGESGTGTDTLVSIENVKGTHGNDVINGDDNNNLLKGLDGEDKINGKGGDDTILPNRPERMDDDGEPTHNADGTDGADVIDGGDHGDDGGDTISYEGEENPVTVNLGDPQAKAPGVDNELGTTDDVIAHVAVTIDGVTDMITVVDMPTEDDPEEENLVSTIENVTGGFGADVLTGDARDNILIGGVGTDTLSGADGNDMLMGGADADELNGGPGNDTLDGGAGADNLNGNAGDDTYLAVNGDTVAEIANEGMDTVYYAPLADDPATADTDESENGVSVTPTPDNVETVFGTQNDDTLTAAAGATVLGLGGDDTLTAGGAGNTLVGCAGENTLVGAAGNDFFGVYNDGDNADTIQNFTTGTTATATTDEIHLKGFDSETLKLSLIPGNATQAGVYVGDDLVAIVGSTDIVAISAGDNPNTAAVETDYTGSQAEVILGALEKSGAVKHVPFDPDKCSSN